MNGVDFAMTTHKQVATERGFMFYSPGGTQRRTIDPSSDSHMPGHECERPPNTERHLPDTPPFIRGSEVPRRTSSLVSRPWQSDSFRRVLSSPGSVYCMCIHMAPCLDQNIWLIADATKTTALERDQYHLFTMTITERWPNRLIARPTSLR